MGQTIGMQFNIFLNQNLYYLLRQPIFLLSILAVNQSKTRRTFDLRWPGLIFPLYSTIRDNGNYLMKIIRFNYSLSHFAIIALATIIIAVNVNRFHCSEQKKRKKQIFFPHCLPRKALWFARGIRASNEHTRRMIRDTLWMDIDRGAGRARKERKGHFGWFAK